MYPLNSLHCRHALLSKFVAAAEEEDVEMREEGCKGKFTCFCQSRLVYEQYSTYLLNSSSSISTYYTVYTHVKLSITYNLCLETCFDMYQ